MNDRDIREITRFPAGVVTLPPSKSAMHRIVICSALAGAALPDKSVSDDVDATVNCVKTLLSGGDTLDCGESGSTLRFLIPVAAAMRRGRGSALGRDVAFTGRGRLLARPIAPLLEELQRHGVLAAQSDGRITISGQIEPGVYDLPGNVSSQFVTGLLLALPLLGGDSEIRLTSPLESRSYVDITLDVMRQFGVTAAETGRGYAVPGGQRYAPRDVAAEGDYSQAAFFLVAGALGRDVGCAGLRENSKQGDRKILELLRRAGVAVVTAPDGSVKALPGGIRPLNIDVSDIPDLVPPLSALLCFADGESRLYNAARLRLKESDRLSAVAEALNRLGADVREDGDARGIRGVKSLNGGTVDSRGDHRIAMMGAVAAIRADGAVSVRDSACVAKSYPNFWRDFEVSHE